MDTCFPCNAIPSAYSQNFRRSIPSVYSQLRRAFLVFGNNRL